MTDNTQSSEYVHVEAEFDVSDTEQTVTVRKLKTRKGERVEFTAFGTDDSLLVDALGLESLAWQDLDSGFIESEQSIKQLDAETDDVTCNSEFELMNEYAHVSLRRLTADDTTTLQINAPKKRTDIQLDANALATITQQDHTLFSKFLEQPHGPEDHH